MKYTGTITRIQASRESVTLIVDIGYGHRAIELDKDVWAEVVNDFGLSKDTDIVGWSVDYDPGSGDLELVGPEDNSNDIDE